MHTSPSSPVGFERRSHDESSFRHKNKMNVKSLVKLRHEAQLNSVTNRSRSDWIKNIEFLVDFLLELLAVL